MMNPTFKIQIRYSDERDYKTVVVGIASVSSLQHYVAYYAGLSGIEDIRIGYDLLETDFRQFTL